MVIELQKLPPLPVQQSPPPQNGRRTGRVSKRSIPNNNQQSLVQPVAVRRKPRNLIKDIVSNDEATPSVSIATAATVEDEVINPISRLLRMQQAAKKREPIYSVIEERGQQKRKEFVVEVECNGEKAQGIGPNKKLAKRMAAENYLIKMGYPMIEPTEMDGAKVTASAKPQRRVVFKEPEALGQAASIASTGGSAGRQLVPGVLLMKSQDNLGNVKAHLEEYSVEMEDMNNNNIWWTFNFSFSSSDNKRWQKFGHRERLNRRSECTGGRCAQAKCTSNRDAD